LQGAETFRSLRTVLARLPKNARVGIDAESLQVSTQTVLADAVDGRDVQDATSLFDTARALKTSWEIDKLRTACHVSENAISAAGALIRPGVTELDLKVCHDGFITSRPIGTGIRLSGISAGATFSIRSFPSTRATLPGELVRFDCGAHLHEYGADIARVFAIQTASDAARRAYDILLTAHNALVASIEPGAETAHLFKQSIAGIRKAGLPDYRRGHVGHSVGLSRAVEEQPLLGPADSQPLQPGMVLSIETPYYLTGIGAINIEDMLVVTENGHTVMNRLPKSLKVVG
jgi:Xaa-Pro aminopeptidase